MPRQTKKLQTKATKGVIWARVSSREQEDGYSLDAQIENSKKYAERIGIEIIKTFEVTESSTHGDRKQFHDMINWVKRQKQSIAIICDKIDRLQRRVSEVPILEELRKEGKIELHFSRENRVIKKDTNGSDLACYRMIVVMAENYTDCIADNVKRSFNQMRKEGKWAHKAPVGYKNVKDSKGNSDIIVDPDRGFLITALFKEYASGIYTLEQITKKAREIGFTMPKCKKLYKQTIRNILTNRFYAGEMYGKGDYYAHQYKTLIDWKTFNRCQEILEGRINHKEQKHEHLFKGIMKCQKCGAMISPYISIHPAKKKGGEKIAYKYLFCPKCKGTHVNEAKGVEKIIQALNVLKTLPRGVLEKMVVCLDDLIYEDHKIEIERKKALERKLASFNDKEARWHELYAEASITRDFHSKKLTELSKEKRAIEEELLNYQHIAKQDFITLKYLASLFLHADQIWNFPKIEQKQKILKLLCSEILLDGKNIVISIRKPISALAEIGSCQIWQDTLADIRTKYPEELLEIHEQANELDFMKNHNPI